VIFTLAFLVVLMVVAGAWLVRHGIAAKPWLATVPAVGVPAAPVPAAVMGLRVFIAVAASLLVLLVSAYAMRMEMADWQPPPQPSLLWANTGVLLLSSASLHQARSAARQGQTGRVKEGLLLGGAGAVVFLIGQVMAWREMAAAGYVLTSNPADAFFYLITAAHGLHVVGGLVALARTGAKAWRGVAPEQLRVSVELCTTYWHFLLIAWIALFSMLSFSPSFTWLYAICAAPFR
jgi:cytochrome c oxidase subunit 3